MGLSDDNYTSPSIVECSTELCKIRVYEAEIIVVPVLLVSVSLIIGFCIFHQICWKKFRIQPLGEEGIAMKLTVSPGLEPPEPPPDSPPLPEIPRERIDGEMVKIGRGRYGDIYKSFLLSDKGERETEIVLKSLHRQAGAAEEREFVARARFHCFLGSNENLVKFLGLCSQQTPKYLCLGYMDCRDLLSFLWECRRNVIKMEGIVYDLTEKQVYRLANQVARGLGYVHSRGVVHGAVGARNVLLNARLEVRLSGLHWAQTRSRSQGREGGQAPPPPPKKWASPETLTHSAHVNSKTDVWSFGILLYELITLGSPPYPDIPCEEILQFLQRGNIHPRPANCHPHLYGLMAQCWRWKAESRPSLRDLLRGLEEGERGADGRNVLCVPDVIEGQVYSHLAGINPSSDYTEL